MNVGSRIRTLRRSLNMSQPDLAKKAKVGQSTISDLENDKKSTSAINMEAIAQALGTSSSYLLTGKQGSKGTIDQVVEHVNNKDEILYQINNLVKIRYYPNLPISCGSGAFTRSLDNRTRTPSIAWLAIRTTWNLSTTIKALGKIVFTTFLYGRHISMEKP